MNESEKAAVSDGHANVGTLLNLALGSRALDVQRPTSQWQAHLRLLQRLRSEWNVRALIRRSDPATACVFSLLLGLSGHR